MSSNANENCKNRKLKLSCKFEKYSQMRKVVTQFVETSFIRNKRNAKFVLFRVNRSTPRSDLHVCRTNCSFYVQTNPTLALVPRNHMFNYDLLIPFRCKCIHVIYFKHRAQTLRQLALIICISLPRQFIESRTVT